MTQDCSADRFQTLFIVCVDCGVRLMISCCETFARVFRACFVLGDGKGRHDRRAAQFDETFYCLVEFQRADWYVFDHICICMYTRAIAMMFGFG